MQALKLPKAAQAMEHGTLVEWLVDEGEPVTGGEPVVRFEAEKATSELVAEEDGFLLRQLVAEDETVPIGTVLGYVGRDVDDLPEDEDAEAGLDRAGDDDTPRTESEDASFVPERSGDGDAPSATEEGTVLASPLARRLAAERDADLDDVVRFAGTAPVRKADVLEYVESTTIADPGGEVDESAPTGPTVAEEVPIEGHRAGMFDRMSQVACEYASTTTVSRIDVTRLWELYRRLSDAWEEGGGVGPSLTAMTIKAVADAIGDYPPLNAAITDDRTLALYDDVNVGFAVDTDDGLVVPTITGADELTVRQLSGAVERLASAARDGELTHDDVGHATFTVSNAGQLGAYLNTPQIVPPQTAILGVCEIVDEPAVVDGEVRPRKIQHLCLTYDHRVIDGAVAVGFLNAVSDRLETPELLIA